jgi:two-component system cell cycle sensor histidine kinase/response regulator CckA
MTFPEEFPMKEVRLPDPVNILLVDDRPDGLLALEAVLNDPQYRLLKAASGAEALAILEREGCAVILLDVQMPQMDGFETASLIKRLPGSMNIPIIFITAINKDLRYVYQGYERGAVDYLFKPFDPQILRWKVAVFVELFQKNKELKRQSEILRKKDGELHEARKMEAIGRLAGGIAHDFNNLITGILGISKDLHSQFDEPDPRRADLEEIIKASDRAFSLTKRLLAFACRQTADPVVLNLNHKVTDLRKMIERLIGEDIQLTTALSPELDMVKADPSQIEQVVLNLVLNARDAITSGGRITISTGNMSLDQKHPFLHDKAKPGRYVALTVADTGRGMDPETMARIFEPFFTTKQNGTGLGLATVYGITKQNRWEIHVESQSGMGSAFTILFPRQRGGIAPREEAPPTVSGGCEGRETILVVEDEEIVRRVVSRILSKKGYRVLEAKNGFDALDLCQRSGEPIGLLVTDVIMPGMNGRELADLLKVQCPEVEALYISGYPQDVITHRGILEHGISFIDKSALHHSLASKVRELLDRRIQVRASA